MTTYARILNNVAVEIFIPHSGFTIAECFTADIAALFSEVLDGTVVNSILANDVWTAPAVNPSPISPSVQYPVISAGMFYNCFTATEMIAIKASTDPLVKEFYARYQVALQVNEPINPNLVSVQEGLAYLAAPVSPGPGAGILASTSRIDQILAGTPQ